MKNMADAFMNHCPIKKVSKFPL